MATFFPSDAIGPGRAPAGSRPRLGSRLAGLGALAATLIALGAWVLSPLLTPQAHAPAAPAASAAALRVLDASGGHQGGNAAQELARLGVEVGSAGTTGSAVRSSYVLYAAGRRAQAMRLARRLGVPVRPQGASSALRRGEPLVLVLGRDGI
jgi:hypothetical protein